MINDVQPLERRPAPALYTLPRTFAPHWIPCTLDFLTFPTSRILHDTVLYVPWKFSRNVSAMARCIAWIFTEHNGQVGLRSVKIFTERIRNGLLRCVNFDRNLCAVLCIMQIADKY